jgi:hypothetical protein
VTVEELWAKVEDQAAEIQALRIAAVVATTEAAGAMARVVELSNAVRGYDRGGRCNGARRRTVQRGMRVRRKPGHLLGVHARRNMSLLRNDGAC